MHYHGVIRDAAALGQMLAQARYAAGLSQRDLADRLGVSQRYVWQMESGEPTTFAVRLFKAMSVCGMTLTAEFDGEGAAPGLPEAIKQNISRLRN